MHIWAKGNNEELYFFTDNGLYVCGNNVRKALLCENCMDEFDVCIGDDVNVVCQSEDGDILKYTKIGNEWTKTVILKSRSRSAAMFGMRIIQTGDVIHFVYGINRGSEKLVVHQLLPDGRPLVIGKIYGDGFFVRRDETGCVYIICEIADKLWHFYTYRRGGWSAGEELAENCGIEDVICDGYKKFAMIKSTENEIFFENADERFVIAGSRPSIARTENGYIVFSELNGRVIYTSKRKSTKIINGGEYVNFHLRLAEGGEYCVCERCRGTLRQNKPRLFVIENAIPGKMAINENTKIEITKHIIGFEARLEELEKRVSALENSVTRQQNQLV